MIQKISLFKQSLHTDDHMVVVETPVFNPKNQRILVSVNNKVAEGVYNPKTGNTTAKLVAPSTNASHPLAAQLPQNTDMRVKVFVYDFMKDKILTAKLQEFSFHPQHFDYKRTDELLSTSPVIIGAWDKKGLVERAHIEEGIVKTDDNSKYYCSHCEEEFTSDLIKDTLGLKKLNKKQVKIIDSILPYLNLYRKNSGLDTCLRKAHFIAQISHESSQFTTFEEDENYYSNISLGVFSNKEIEINSIILDSLKENLKDIFKVTDKDDLEISKTNDELYKLLLKDKPKIIDGELYGIYKGELNPKDKKKRVSKLIKEILKSDKTIDYKIYLKPHSKFGVALMSRAYAPYTGDKRGLGNGDESTKDGWKFKGRGLKQITGREHYKNFSNYRNENPYTDDSTGKIDFTAEKKGEVLKGNYLKLSEEAIYAVQSSLWFWNSGTKKNKKYAKDNAEDDDIDLVTACVNQYDSEKGKNNRKRYYTSARMEMVFDINRHYKLMFDNGNETQKKVAKEYLEKRKKSSDKQATKMLEEINKNDTKKSELPKVNVKK